MWWRNEAPKMRRRLAKEHIMTCNIHAMHPDQGSCDMSECGRGTSMPRSGNFGSLPPIPECRGRWRSQLVALVLN